MSAWLTGHGHALLQMLRRLAQAPVSHLLTIAVIGITLSLPAGLFLLIDNLARLGERLHGEPQLTVFMARNASTADIERMSGWLKHHPDIRQHQFVAKEQALKDLETHAGLSNVGELLDRNPLPDAFVVNARSGEPRALEKLRDLLQAQPKVEAVQLDSAWASRLHAILELGRQAVVALALLLGVALVAVTGNTIRLQILTQRDEIEVSRLIGATDSFVRRPFLYFGTLLGFGGGLLALLILAACTLILRQGVNHLASLYATQFPLTFPGPAECAILLSGAAALGWMGAHLSVSRYLRAAP